MVGTPKFDSATGLLRCNYELRREFAIEPRAAADAHGAAEDERAGNHVVATARKTAEKTIKCGHMLKQLALAVLG